MNDLVGYCPKFMEDVVITGDVDAVAMSFSVTANAAVSDAFVKAFNAAVSLVGDVVLAFRFLVAIWAYVLVLAVFTDSISLEKRVFCVVALKAKLAPVSFAVGTFRVFLTGNAERVDFHVAKLGAFGVGASEAVGTVLADALAFNAGLPAPFAEVTVFLEAVGADFGGDGGRYWFASGGRGGRVWGWGRHLERVGGASLIYNS